MKLNRADNKAQLYRRLNGIGPYFMVLVIPAGKSAKQGKWWLETTTEPRRPSKVPAAIRIASAQKMEDNFAKAD